MVVECPRCHARFLVEETEVRMALREKKRFGCSRCEHEFEPPDIPETPPKEERRAPSRSPGLESMSFAFEVPGNRPRQPEPDELDEEEEPVAPAEAEIEPEVDRAVDMPPPPPTPFSPEPDDEDDLETDEFEIEPPFEDERPPREPGSDRTAIRVVAAFLVAIVLVFGNLSLYLRGNAEAAERFLRSLPVYGSMLAKDENLRTQVYLKDVTGEVRQAKGARLVFVVSGRAVNASDRPLRGIRVESRLLVGSGDAEAVRQIYCGNALSPAMVGDLSPRELEGLQQIQPPKRFRVEPSGEAGFTVVFPEVPEGISEFTVEVASVSAA